MRAVTVAEQSAPWALQALAQRDDVSDAETALLRRCRRLLERCDQQNGPISLRTLMAQLGARQASRPMAVDGHLAVEAGRWKVSIDSRAGYRRSRFTAAHEIGHILLCEALLDVPGAIRALQRPDHWQAVERLCNRAAAELLMPATDFEAQVLRHGLTPNGLRGLYDRYIVSWEPLLVRVCETFAVTLTTFSERRSPTKHRSALRVARSSSTPETWLPAGLSGRYLMPDVISAAQRDGAAASTSVTVDLSVPRRPLQAVAVSLHAAAAAGSGAARLAGFAAADDPQVPFDVGLLMGADASDQWVQVIERTAGGGAS